MYELYQLLLPPLLLFAVDVVVNDIDVTSTNVVVDATPPAAVISAFYVRFAGVVALADVVVVTTTAFAITATSQSSCNSLSWETGQGKE